MTAPLDEKGLEAAWVAGGIALHEHAPEIGKIQRTAIVQLVLDVALPAYLSVALPDELEVVGFSYRDKWRDDLRWSLSQIKPSAVKNRLIEPLVRASQASQAHSTIAALRAAIATPEAVYANMLRGSIPKLSIRQALHLHGAEALEKWDRAETAEAEVKRLTEEKEALERHNQALLDKVSSEDCACAYDHPDDVCLGHSPKLQAAEARIKALEEALEPSIEHIDTLVELLKVIKEHWIDYDHVFSIAVHEADDFLLRHKAGSKE